MSKDKETRKKCNTCGKNKDFRFYFKVDSHQLFPDGMINTCRDCVRESVDVDNIEEVISFLRQIDKPFIESYWNESLQTNRHPLGEYMRKMNSLQQMKGKTFEDSKGLGLGRAADITVGNIPDNIEAESGQVIEYSDNLITKWGIGYKKDEYLRMEKFYQDMKSSHDIRTPIHKDILVQLSKLTIVRNRYLEQGNMNDYDKASKAFEAMMKSAGFRPVDRKGTDEETGLRTFSQIWEEVEKRGFRKPPPIELDRDIVDAQITALANYYHRIIGKQILSEIPDDVKSEIDEFFEDDLTPVDLDDEYNNLEDYEEIAESAEDLGGDAQ